MPAVPIIALGVAAVGTGYSIYSGERAASQSKKAQQAQQAQADLQAARQKRDAIRAARMAQAQAISNSESQGVANSSSAEGGQGSIISQMNDNLSFLDSFNKYSQQATTALGNAEMYRVRSQEGGQIASMGMEAMQYAPDISRAWNKIFTPKGP